MRDKNQTIVVEALSGGEDSLSAIEAMMTLVQKEYEKSGNIDFPKIDEVLSYITLPGTSELILGLFRAGVSGLERVIFRRDSLPNIRVEVIYLKDVEGSQAVVLVFHRDTLVQTITRTSVMQGIKF